MIEFRHRVEDFRREVESFVGEHEAVRGLSLDTAEDVKRYVEENGVTSIRLWFTDILGFLKSFSITPAELDGAFEEGMGFDGSSIQGYKRIHESDMVARPIPETAQLIPFRIGGAKAIRMFAKVTNPDGTDYEGDPRILLKRNLSRLDRHGLANMYVGPEAEYYYFANEKEARTIDRAGYFDLNPVDAGDDLREATIFCLEAMGIAVEYSHHEVGPSQHEIDLKYSDALRMADTIQTYKWIVKEVAIRNGVHATFMPKPLADENGSGMHTHLSLFSGEKKNAFYSKGDPHHLTPLAKHFIAGVLHHAEEISLVTNQWYNSYKRLVPGFEAPVYIAWAERNRSALIRVPQYKPGKELATRIELRFPDAACNPYLAFGVMLAAGLAGVEGKMPCPDQVTSDLYEMTPMQREDQNIRTLPNDLYAAIQKAEKSELVREALGEHVVSKLVETKLEEYLSHRHHVTRKELDDYMVL